MHCDKLVLQEFCKSSYKNYSDLCLYITFRLANKLHGSKNSDPPLSSTTDLASQIPLKLETVCPDFGEGNIPICR